MQRQNNQEKMQQSGDVLRLGHLIETLRGFTKDGYTTLNKARCECTLQYRKSVYFFIQ